MKHMAFATWVLIAKTLAPKLSIRRMTAHLHLEQLGPVSGARRRARMAIVSIGEYVAVEPWCVGR